MRDFDYWANLYKSDPIKFEQERTTIVSKLIKTCKPKNKLKYTALQARINLLRRKNKPLDNCIIISQMMWDSFDEMNRMFNEIK
jgi:hypothetical protein